jgi:hypothetical protein
MPHCHVWPKNCPPVIDDWLYGHSLLLSLSRSDKLASECDSTCVSFRCSWSNRCRIPVKPSQVDVSRAHPIDIESSHLDENACMLLGTSVMKSDSGLCVMVMWTSCCVVRTKHFTSFPLSDSVSSLFTIDIQRQRPPKGDVPLHGNPRVIHFRFPL